MSACLVGQFRVGERSVPFALSVEDRERDAGSARGLLRLLGVARGDALLMISLLSEAASYWPLQLACVREGVILSAADATSFDAARTRMFCAQLCIGAVVGVHADTLAGLAQLGADAKQVLGAVPVLAARPDVIEPLRAAGLAPRLWLGLGPALGVECRPGGGAHVDPALWEIQERGGEILLSSRTPRETPLARAATGVRGGIVSEPCACGYPGPRVVLT